MKREQIPVFCRITRLVVTSVWILVRLAFRRVPLSSNSLAAFLGPLYGIMVVDYYLIKRQRVLAVRGPVPRPVSLARQDRGRVPIRTTP
jgi:hypothetical protein